MSRAAVHSGPVEIESGYLSKKERCEAVFNYTSEGVDK